MKKAKALQDFWYGSEKISKGDVLEYARPASSWYCRVRTIMVPNYIVETNPHIFQCPYEEKLTSEQWDEKARGYGYWIPRDGKTYFFVRVSWGKIDSSYFDSWCGDCMDMALLRAGLAVETREEAEELLKKLKGEKS